MSGVEGSDGLFSRSQPDEERISICPLLTPSPTSADFQHPLAISTTPVMDYDRQLSPSSVDTDNSSCPPVSTNTDFIQDDTSKGMPTRLVEQCTALEGSSSSSSCSVMQDSTASAQLLNSRNYLTLATDVNCQENGGIKGTGLVGLTLGKSTQEFGFTSWNWSLIRRCCFWGVASVTVACVCIIIAYITTIPTRCDPPRAWFQGSLIYQVFPASFQDSDGNGVGDLRGVAGRLSYIRDLGAKGVRLSYIFPAPHYPEDFTSVENLTKVDPSIGSLQDLTTLANDLHEMNMTLILDLPLHPHFQELKSRDPLSQGKEQVKHVIVNNHILVSPVNKTSSYGTERSIVTDIMAFWMDQGVDGFYLQGLEHFVNDDNFLGQVEEWKLETYRRDRVGGFEKALICSYEVIRALKEVALLEVEAKTNTVLRTFDLMELRLDPFAQGTRSVLTELNEVQGGLLYSRPGGPWPYWTLGDVGLRRLANKASSGNLTLAATVASMILPGSSGILYGDEIGLMDIQDPDGERRDLANVHGLGPMHWESGGKFNKLGVLGWLPPAPTALPYNMAVETVTTVSSLRDNNPSIYMHALWSKEKLLPNTAIRLVDNEVLTLERSYPRRHTYLLIANLSPNRIQRDLSKQYYGGYVVLDTDRPSGRYITFQKVTLNPGHVIVAKLDK